MYKWGAGFHPETSNERYTMIKINLPPPVVSDIKARAAKRGVLNSRTMIGGKGNETGFAGEAAFQMLADQRGWTCRPMGGDRDCDFTVDGQRIDVKSRAAAGTPRNDWDCKIPEYSLARQKCDGYVFAIVNPDLSSVWIVGAISKEGFRRKSTPLTHDASGKSYTDPHRAVRISDLNSL